MSMIEGRCLTVSLPFSIHSMSVASQFDWVVTESQTNRYLVSTHAYVILGSDCDVMID